jgi:hypothetical protein
VESKDEWGIRNFDASLESIAAILRDKSGSDYLNVTRVTFFVSQGE